MHIIIFLICFCTGLFASAGETGYNFLKIDTGNRAIAMGGAYAGVSRDIISIYYNPAGISELNKKEVYFMYRKWLFNTDYGSLSYAQNFKKIGSMGISVIYYQLPEVPEVDSLGYDTGSILSGNNYALIFTLAREVYAGILMGLNIKYLNERVFNSENKSIVLDLGLQKEIYTTPSDSIVLGAAIQNWNTKFNIDYSNPVPLNIKTGMEYMAYKNFKLNFDINKQIDRDFRYNIGAEYKFFNMILIRSGYKIGYDLESFSVGFGVDSQYFFHKIVLNIDYSFTSLGLLSKSQNFSLKIRF